MESNSRTALRAHGIRPLGLPRPLTVRTNARGEPVEVTLGTAEGEGTPGARRTEQRNGEPRAIEHIEEVWRVAEAWWREAPIRRTYYRVLIEGGRPLTLFRDDSGTSEDSTTWYEQRY